MSYLKKIPIGRSGGGYINMAVLILCMMLALVLSVKIPSVFIAKQQLDVFATKLCRETEITGRIGSETNRRVTVLREKTGLNPEIHWSTDGRIQLNEEVTMWLTCRYNLGLFGGLGSLPITFRATTTGKSEAYWK